MHTVNNEQKGYVLDYNYDNELHPNAPNKIVEAGKSEPRQYVYDGNGNPTSYSEEKSFRKMTWDEENRLTGINDNGRIYQYTYDASGERVIKSSGDSQNVAINGETAATIIHTDDYTAYVSPYFVVRKGKFTKHYFEGAGRIVSKLGNGTFAQPLGITAGGVNYTQLTADQQKALDTYVKSLGVPPGPPTQQGIYATPEFTGNPYPSEALKPVEENQEPPKGWPRNPMFNAPGDVPGPPVQFGPPVQPATVQPGEGFTGIGLPENDIFYFHSDHLGSTSYITTKNGSVSQHVEYIAFGEVLFEEHSSSFSSPYLFNGKELDRETNLTYYGARYLDMKTSLWLNVDPLALYNPIFEEEFYFDGDHNGGIYNSGNLSNYNYCYQNPIVYQDPNGKQNYSVILGRSSRLISNTAAAALGSTHATVSAYSVGLGDLFEITEPPKTFSRSELISYYAGRAIADIAVIVEGSSISGTGGTMGLTTGAESGGIGVLVGGVVAVYGGGVSVAGTVDLGQSLVKLMSMGIDPENTFSSSPSESDSAPLNGGGKNGKHKNQQAKQSAQEKYESSKKEYERLKSIPNKTKTDVKARDVAEKQMKHWQKKSQETGENHSQKAKGSN